MPEIWERPGFAWAGLARNSGKAKRLIKCWRWCAGEIARSRSLRHRRNAQRFAGRALSRGRLDAYNHNLDTSPEYYEQIITTRTYGDRLQTLDSVRRAGITLCCGGIVGMGETLTDRARMLEILATMTPHPESVPINALTAVAGTPLENQQPVDPLELVRMCATARILLPKARIRLSAGRSQRPRSADSLLYGGR